MVQVYGDESGTMIVANIKLQGARRLDRKLRMLPTRLAKKGIRQGLRAGAKIVHAQAVANAPVDTELLKKSLKVRAIKRRRGSIGVAVQTKDGNFKGETFYGAFQELGWKHGSRKLGNARKQIPGKHYMKRAAESKKEEAAQAVADVIAVGVVREAKAL